MMMKMNTSTITMEMKKNMNTTIMSIITIIITKKEKPKNMVLAHSYIIAVGRSTQLALMSLWHVFGRRV